MSEVVELNSHKQQDLQNLDGWAYYLEGFWIVPPRNHPTEEREEHRTRYVHHLLPKVESRRAGFSIR